MTISDLQQRLAALGFYRGAIDGRYGDGTSWSPACLLAGRSRHTDPTDPMSQNAAAALNTDPAHVRTVRDVEAAGAGFANGLPKILFEGHIFSRLTGGRSTAPIRRSPIRTGIAPNTPVRSRVVTTSFSMPSARRRCGLLGGELRRVPNPRQELQGVRVQQFVRVRARPVPDRGRSAYRLRQLHSRQPPRRRAPQQPLGGVRSRLQRLGLQSQPV
jgi:hypothetical protein